MSFFVPETTLKCGYIYCGERQWSSKQLLPFAQVTELVSCKVEQIRSWHLHWAFKQFAVFSHLFTSFQFCKEGGQGLPFPFLTAGRIVDPLEDTEHQW